jgi:hypothetical protein
MATAWGQAVFRGGGNVMTRMWAKRSKSIQLIYGSQSPAYPAHLLKPRTKAAKGRGRAHLGGIEKIQKSERGAPEVHLPPQVSRDHSRSSLWPCSRISPAATGVTGSAQTRQSRGGQGDRGGGSRRKTRQL